MRFKRCDQCGGSGHHKYGHWEATNLACGYCGGTGKVRDYSVSSSTPSFFDPPQKAKKPTTSSPVLWSPKPSRRNGRSSQTGGFMETVGGLILLVVILGGIFNRGSSVKAVPAKSGDYAVVRVDHTAKVHPHMGWVSLRESPSLGATVIQTLAPETKLTCHYCCCDDYVNNKDGKWCYVSYRNKEGYIWGWEVMVDK